MAASKFKISVDQGSTYRRTITWKAGTPAVPVDLTGCTAMLQMREKIESPAVLYELISPTGIVLGDAAGTVELVIPAEDSSLWSWRAAVYDLEITFPDTSVRRLLSGSVSVSPEVTRV
jgi:hypothetical protein